MSDASGILGLASRARQTATGEMVLKKVRDRKAYLVILAEDIGENSRKKLLDKCSFYHVPCVFMDGNEMNQAIGDNNKKSIAIVDEGFAQKLHTCLKG